jgi:hypothetical protein
MKTKNVACEKIIDVFQPTIFLKWFFFFNWEYI